MKLTKRYHWLANEINTHRFKSGAEVGAATGITTEYLMHKCPKLKKLIIADNWSPINPSHTANKQWLGNDMEKVFRQKLKPYYNRLVIMKGLSWEVANGVANSSLDFVFIDASHDKESFVKDVTAWLPKVHMDGMICGHDLHFEGVQEGLREMLPMFNKTGVDNCWFVHMHDYAAYTQHA